MYSRRELKAIHDFLVEQSAEIEEYLDEMAKEYDRKSDVMVRMNYQWAVRIGLYLDWLCSGVDEAIKDV